jgi:hypothetical protein
MIDHEFKIQATYTKPATIFFFGDLQWGAPGFDNYAWEEFKREFKSTPNAWALGLGDYGDWLRPSMRAPLKASMTKDKSARVMMDDMIRRKQDDLINKMAFLEGKLIGLHQGHHCWEFASGDNSDMRICSALKTKYMGWMADTRLMFKGYREKDTLALTMVSMHGTGNSRYTGTDSRWLDQNIVPAFDAEVYVKGHGCKADAWSPFERQIVKRKGAIGLARQKLYCLNVPGFSRGYTNGWDSSYVEQAGFQPQPLGWGIMRVWAHHGENRLAKLRVEHLVRVL